MLVWGFFVIEFRCFRVRIYDMGLGWDLLRVGVFWGRVDLGVEIFYKVLFSVYIRVGVGVEVRILFLHGLRF